MGINVDELAEVNHKSAIEDIQKVYAYIYKQYIENGDSYNASDIKGH